MAYPIIKISDFEAGELMLQQNNNVEAEFNSVRDEHAGPFLRSVLGAALGNLFIADIGTNGVPTTTRFTNLFNAFQEDYGCSVIESKGIKQMLKEAIWYFYARQNNTVISGVGNRQAAAENSTPTSDNFYLARIHNSAIDTGKAIQWYILEHIDNYTEYNGQELRYVIGLQ